MVVTGGKDALDKAIKLKASVVLLSNVMPQMNGEEAFLALSENIPDIRTYIICKNPAEAASAEFLAQHPDCIVAMPYAQKTIGEYLVPEMGGVLAEYLKKDLSVPKDNIDQRLSPRVIAQGFVEFDIKGSKHKGVILNLSKTGALFSSKVEVPLGHEFVLDMHTPSGVTIQVNTQVVRVKKDEDTKGEGYALGARFLEVTPEQLEHLELWIAALRSVMNQITEQVDSPSSGDEAYEPPAAQAVDELKEKLDFYFEGTKLGGEAITVNPNWILLESDRSFLEGQVVKIRITSASAVFSEVSAQIVKSQPKKENVFRAGAKYIFLDEAQKKSVQDWVAKYGAILSKEVAAPDAKFVQRILTVNADMLIQHIAANPFDPRLRFVGVLTPMEQDALRRQDSAAICLQRLICGRAKCGLLYDFLPTIQANTKVIGEAFLRIFSTLLSETDELEREAEGEVRRAVNENNNELRVELNASSNKFHDIKGRVLLAAVDRLGGSSLAEAPGFGEIMQRAERVRSVQIVEDVKYKRKQEVKKHEKKKKKQTTFVSKKIKIGMTIALFTIFLAVIFRAKSGYIAPSKLELEFDLLKVVATDDGVSLYCNEMMWDRLRDSDKEQTVISIEKYLTKEHLKQAKLLNEQGKLLAATAVVERPIGKDPVYKRRMKGSKSF